VRAYCEASLKADAQAMLELYADDVIVHYFGRSPLAGDHVGKAAVAAALAKQRALTDRKLIEIHDAMASVDHGVILTRERWERDGTSMEVRRVFVYHIRDGKVTEAWAYDNDQRAVDEFWA